MLSVLPHSPPHPIVPHPLHLHHVYSLPGQPPKQSIWGLEKFFLQSKGRRHLEPDGPGILPQPTCEISEAK